MLIRMLVLANSSKNRGRCLAGLNVETGKWVRPVPNTESRVIDNERTIIAERFIRPGDLIDVEIGSALPLPYHPEDVELTGRIRLVGKETTKYMADLVFSELSKPNQLLENSIDRISFDQIRVSPARNSLALSMGSGIRFSLNERGSNRVKFRANDMNWSLANTDDKLESEEYIDEALICISLAEPFEPTQSHHKLAAGFIPLRQWHIESKVSKKEPELPQASEAKQMQPIRVLDTEPRVGRKVHTQKYGIGVIKMVGEFYLEIDFSDMGAEFLSRDDLELDYLD
jgi:hypothetical protein